MMYGKSLHVPISWLCPGGPTKNKEWDRNCVKFVLLTPHNDRLQNGTITRAQLKTEQTIQFHSRSACFLEVQFLQMRMCSVFPPRRFFSQERFPAVVQLCLCGCVRVRLCIRGCVCVYCPASVDLGNGGVCVVTNDGFRTAVGIAV